MTQLFLDLDSSSNTLYVWQQNAIGSVRKEADEAILKAESHRYNFVIRRGVLCHRM